MKQIVMFILALLVSSPLMAQVKVSGTVYDGSTKGEPMIGANVSVKGTTIGMTTGADGKFVINAPSAESVIVFSFIGYKTQEVKIGTRSIFDITLAEDSEKLDELVVVGYGTVKKRDLSGSVASIKSSDLMKGNPSDLGTGLQGKIAGVTVSQNDGAPGAGISINIRGANSFTTSTQPLYIVDGIPFDTGDTPSSDANSNNNQTSNPLNFINPRDIQSIEVLKDASATAIYGSRGANGVVIVTTKRGEKGQDKVEFGYNIGIAKISKKLDVLDAYTYAQYVNEGTLNSAKYSNKPYSTLPYAGVWTYSNLPDGTINQSTGKYNPSPEDFLTPGERTDQYGNVYKVGTADWQDEIFQTGITQEYNLSVSGASDKGWHSFSGNYLNQKGTIVNSGFTRYSIRANIGRKIYDWLEIGLNSSFTNTNTDFAKTNAYDYGILRSTLIFPVTYDPHMDLTQSDELSWLASNPYQYVHSAKDNLKAINSFNSGYVQLQLLPFLKFRQNVGLGYTDNRRSTYYDRHTAEGRTPTNGKGGQADNWWQSLTSESLLQYDQTFNEIHTFNAVAGFTYEQADWGSKSMTATNFPSDITGEYDMSQGLNPGTLVSDRGRQVLNSFLFRLNYTLMSKYLFTVSFRRDGSSKFTDKNKWANFLSGAFAWNLSEEKFIKDLNFFNNLKLRLSYGQTGNQAIGSYRTMAQLKASNYPFGGSLSSGFSEVEWRGPVSDDLKWETTSQYNIGLDMAFLKNRIAITVDAYYKKTRDLLQEVKIAPSTGFSNMMINSGNVTNKGIEITGDFKILTGDFKWNMNANIAFNRNAIGGLAADQYANRLWYKADNIFLQRNGCPIGTIYGYVEDGFYDNEAEVRADPVYTNASDAVVKSKIGEIKYRNFDDDPTITDADRTIIGNTNPDFTYGVTANFEYKNITMSLFFQGSQGNDIFNGNLMDIQMANVGNITRDAYNSRWTEDNFANAKWPKVIAGYDRNMLISDRYVQDGSYLKLKSLTLGYNWFPKFKYINKVNFTFTATNLFCITGYDWYDPDVNAFATDASRRGVDIYSYPSSRTFTLGVNIQF